MSNATIELQKLSKNDLIKLIESLQGINLNGFNKNKFDINDKIVIKSGMIGKVSIRASQHKEIHINSHSKGTRVTVKELDNCLSFTKNLSQLIEKGLIYFDDDSVYEYLGLDIPEFKYSEDNLRELFQQDGIEIVNFIKTQINNNSDKLEIKLDDGNNLTILNSIQFNLARLITNGFKMDISQSSVLNEYFSPISVEMMVNNYRLIK